MLDSQESPRSLEEQLLVLYLSVNPMIRHSLIYLAPDLSITVLPLRLLVCSQLIGLYSLMEVLIRDILCSDPVL